MARRRSNVVHFRRGIRRARSRGTPRSRGLRSWRPRWRRLKTWLIAILALVAVAVVVVSTTVDLLIAGIGARGAFGCRIVQVVDGDTARLWCRGRGLQKVRFVGFDTPEKFSPKCASESLRAEAATWVLRWTLLRGELLTLRFMGEDRYGRSLVRAHVDGVGIATTLIAAGLARPYDGGLRGGWCDR